MAPLRTLCLIIKNADGATPDAALSQFNAYSSIREIKTALFESYPGRPVADGQKLIFAGRCAPSSPASYPCAGVPRTEENVPPLGPPYGSRHRLTVGS